MRLFRLGIVVAAAALLMDQVSKWWIRDVLMDSPHNIPITSFFDLVFAWNPGIAFSLFGMVAPWGLIVVVALAIVVGLGVWLSRQIHRWPAIGLGFIIGGALGNVVDRFRFQAVFDFLWFHGEAYPGFCRILETVWLGGFGCQWPAFNLADTCIFIGVSMLVLDGLFRREEKGKTAP